MYVIDASVALRWFLTEERHPHSERVLERVLEQPGLFAVPELFAFEVLAVLCRLHPAPERAFVEGLLPILQGGILRHPMTESLGVQAARYVPRGLTAYDACYAALARELGALWITFDRHAHEALAGEAVSWNLSDSLPPRLA